MQKIISLYDAGMNGEFPGVFLGQMIQIWDESAMAFSNNFAYAILGIPSTIFGIMICRMNPAGKFM